MLVVATNENVRDPILNLVVEASHSNHEDGTKYLGLGLKLRVPPLHPPEGADPTVGW